MKPCSLDVYTRYRACNEEVVCGVKNSFVRQRRGADSSKS